MFDCATNINVFDYSYCCDFWLLYNKNNMKRLLGHRIVDTGPTGLMHTLALTGFQFQWCLKYKQVLSLEDAQGSVYPTVEFVLLKYVVNFYRRYGRGEEKGKGRKRK